MKRNAAVFFINSLQHGGAERVVVNQAEEMYKRGYLVYIILIHNCIAYELSQGIRIKVLGKSGRFRKVICALSYACKLDNALKEIKKECSICLLTANLPYAHYICRLSDHKKKFLYVMHNPQFHFRYSKAYWFRKKIKWMLGDMKVVGVSQGVVDELCNEYSLKRENVHLIYNPIDFKKIENCLKEKTDIALPKYEYLLFVGRLTRQKNIFRLLKAYKKSKANGKIKLVLIGIGELKTELEDYAKSLKIEKYIVFNGWENNVFPWMKNAKGLVCSSDYESFGMVIAEALYCNCSVVSTNCNFGPAEILTDEFSNYLSELNADSLASKINALLEGAYPENKKSLVSKFDVSFIMDKYVDIYQRSGLTNEW